MMRILLIDDEPGILEVLDKFLTKEGHEVVTCQSGRKALAMVDGEEFRGIDVVVLDLRMPEVDGRTILRRIKKESDKPVVILTGSLHGENASELGADAVLIKPVAVEVLMDNIAQVLGKVGK